MLPLEILRIVYSFLDLPSLCTLAQSDTLDVPDDIFKHRLKLLCPWFDPQFSHRSSYKECAIEFLRRQQDGARFAPEWKRVSPDEFGPLVSQTETSSRHVMYSGMEWDKSSLEPEQVLTETLLGDGVYISKHGISVDLSRDSHDWPKWIFQEYEYAVQSFIVSLENMLIITTCSPDPWNCASHVIVKFKDSPGLNADVTDTSNAEFYTFEVLGAHVFLYEHHVEGDGYSWWIVKYLTKDGCLAILSSEDARDPEQGEEGIPQPIFYDGLFHFMDYNDEGDSLVTIQCWMNGGGEISSMWQDVSTEFGLHDAWRGCTELVFKGECRYAMVNEEFPYVYDLYRGLVVDLMELLKSDVVDQTFVTRMEDSGYYVDD